MEIVSLASFLLPSQFLLLSILLMIHLAPGPLLISGSRPWLFLFPHFLSSQVLIEKCATNIYIISKAQQLYVIF